MYPLVERHLSRVHLSRANKVVKDAGKQFTEANSSRGDVKRKKNGQTSVLITHRPGLRGIFGVEPRMLAS